MKDVVFEPYKGKRYKENNDFGLRVLVLGESHYLKDNVFPNFTERVVEWFTQNKRKAFFTKIAKVLLGIDNACLSDAQLAEIWDQVAFYNYIQCFVGNDSRISPTEEMWQAAKLPFLSVLDELEPNVVLVLGVNLWNHLQPIPKGPVFCGIKHPSSSRFNYRESIPKFIEALNSAKEKVALRA